jgi:hypothetical protein
MSIIKKPKTTFVLPRMPRYGAVELKRNSHKFFIRSLIAACVLHILIFSIFLMAGYSKKEEPVVGEIRIMKYFQSGSTDSTEGLTIDSFKMMPVPARPGSNGKSVGTGTNQPFFQIDIPRCNQSLDWDELVGLDPTADIEIFGMIDQNGKLSITKSYIGTHTVAGERIIQAISTWNYTNTKTGEIRFWFNLGANFVQVDVRGLKSSLKNVSDEDMKIGLCLWISGIPQNAYRVVETKTTDRS